MANPSDQTLSRSQSIIKDVIAGIVVFLVALPLCLGIAVASNADPFAGIVSGIIGGIVVGILSGSHTSVSGPAAGLTAVIAVQIATLGSFDAFLAAVLVAGIIQIILGCVKAGIISAFVPSSVIKGLLSAIGVILIIKQLPKVLGHQKAVAAAAATTAEHGGHAVKHENIFAGLLDLFSGEYFIVPLLIGLGSMAFLMMWDKIKVLKKSVIPAPLLVVIAGTLVTGLLPSLGLSYSIPDKMLVSVPVASSAAEMMGLIRMPDFSALLTPAVYVAGLTIAIVASLETLLNLEAVDNIDPKRRYSPPNRELVAQGVGNMIAGLLGGLPMTSVIVRSSVNINMGAQSKISAILHGFLLLGFVLLLPKLLNMIPYASLAAILMVTGFKLVSPKMIFELWKAGRYQFVPFVVTVVAIVATDLLIGILIGLGTSLAFILHSNYRRPIRRIMEKHLGGEVLHIELANQVSFLNKAALDQTLRNVPKGGKVLLDASRTDYIDPDILALIRDYRNKVAPAHGVQVSMRGFQSRYEMHDDVQYVDYSTKELQDAISPQEVMQLLLDGNARFRTGNALSRDASRQVQSTSQASYPMAVVLSCSDSRTPTELIFDLGVGDVMNVCLAGNVMIGPRVLASIEYGCAVAGAKLVVILGHTGSHIMSAAIDVLQNPGQVDPARFGEHFSSVAEEIRPAYEKVRKELKLQGPISDPAFVDDVTRAHIIQAVDRLTRLSGTIEELVSSERIAIVAVMYDVRSGTIEVVHATSASMQTA
ncbi:MAG: bifunctional SulP family inorganic anion transporter/carbonic anhydrase [Planctomycetes bacterium]|nr:bifunctional SulP family inorganic anion transporter/carbonic anhydrase [Planctomycetota bacterium]